MNVSCSAFRRLVEEALVGAPDPGRLTGLAFHEHLVACGPCRELLEGEEALEVLLASWPRPELPAALSARLVERLRQARRLEELLELDVSSVPEGLTERVLQGVARRHLADAERRLDAWLDLAGEVQVPPGLPQRVLARLERERPVPVGARTARTASTARRTPATAPRPVLVRRIVDAAPRAAAVLVATLGLGLLWRLTGSEARLSPADELEIAMAAPPDELLSALPVLENWEVLFTRDDPELATGMDFTVADEALLDFIGAEDLALDAGGLEGAAGSEGARGDR